MQLPVGVNDAELEERIIQHLAAAAAMGRAHHISRREALRNRPSAQGRRPQYLVFSHSNDEPSSTGPISSLSPTQSEGEPAPPITVGSPSFPARTAGEESPASITLPSVQAYQQPASASSSSILLVNDRGNSSNTRYLLFSNSILLAFSFIRQLEHIFSLFFGKSIMEALVLGIILHFASLPKKGQLNPYTLDQREN